MTHAEAGTDGQLTNEQRIEALHERLAAHSLGGHWQERKERDPALVPHVWPWETIYSCLMESGEVIKLGRIDEAAKRRTVNLVNPATPGRKSTSRTLQMSVQLVKAGETAECHRHTAAALRFVVEGDGTAFTNVEGEQMLMEPNDLVLTPHWTWHDHQNVGTVPVVWLDVLDVHLTNFLDATAHENYNDAQDQNGNYFEGATQPVVREDGYGRQRYGVVRSRSGVGTDGRAVPYAYKWRDTLQSLEQMVASGDRDPYDGVLLEYTNPVTGGPTMPTISCRAQWLAPGESTQVHRHTSSTIYHVIQGEGSTFVGPEPKGGEEQAWGLRDCFFVPSMGWHRHVNRSKTDPALLFSVTDRPVLESLGLYREEHA
jgi:gentisate 1,2-dioxygenase